MGQPSAENNLFLRYFDELTPKKALGIPTPAKPRTHCEVETHQLPGNASP